MARFSNIVERINRGRFGVDVVIVSAGSHLEDVGRRHKSSEKRKSVRMRVLEQGRDGDVRTISLSLSGVAGYEPVKTHKLLVNGTEYKVTDVEAKQVGAELYEYIVKGAG